MNRKICVITGARAEYGLLRWVMQGIQDDSELTLQIIATGMHLSPDFGLTYKEIENDGFQIDRQVEMLTNSDTAVGIAKSMGHGMVGFADALHELKPATTNTSLSWILQAMKPLLKCAPVEQMLLISWCW